MAGILMHTSIAIIVVKTQDFSPIDQFPPLKVFLSDWLGHEMKMTSGVCFVSHKSSIMDFVTKTQKQQCV